MTTSSFPPARFACARRRARTWLAVLAVCAWAANALSAPERSLAVEVVSRQGDSVRLRLTNLSNRYLHPLGPRTWGSWNLVKVGFESAPVPRFLSEWRLDDA